MLSSQEKKSRQTCAVPRHWMGWGVTVLCRLEVDTSTDTHRSQETNIKTRLYNINKVFLPHRKSLNSWITIPQTQKRHDAILLFLLGNPPYYVLHNVRKCIIKPLIKAGMRGGDFWSCESHIGGKIYTLLKYTSTVNSSKANTASGSKARFKF